MFGRGVLRLVHQDVVDAAVEAEEDPCGDGRVVQEVRGAGDEVVEVEPAALGLALFVEGKEGGGEAVEGEGAVHRVQRAAGGAGGFHAAHEVFEPVEEERAEGSACVLGGEGADLGGEGFLGLWPGEEAILKCREGGEGGVGEVERGEFGGGLFVIAALGAQGGEDVGHPCGFVAEEGVGEQGFDGFTLFQAKEAARGVRGEGVGEAGAVAHDLLHEVAEVFARPCAGEAGDDVGGDGVGQFLYDLVPQEAGGAVVEFGELRADRGFQREAAEEAGAEAVDGLDAQTARRFDGAGEQAAGLGQSVGVDPRAFAEFGEGGAQVGIGFHGPFAETLEQAVLHLGRRRLGVGEAEDVLGFHPTQKQAGDAVGQHTGLAGARIGGEPCGEGGFCGLHLTFGGGLRHFAPPTGWDFGWLVVSHSP